MDHRIGIPGGWRLQRGVTARLGELNKSGFPDAKRRNHEQMEKASPSWQRGRAPRADRNAIEPLARARISQMAYDYLRSGGADEITMRENRLGFDRLRLSPRVLTDVSKIDTHLSLFGCELEYPMLLAPIAYHRLFHPDGELATARGASAAGAALTVSSFTTTAIDEIARNTRQPFWFQLYVQRDRDFTKGMVQRAVAAGAKVVCLTADTPVLGCRYGQLAFHLPPGIECVHLRG